MYLWSTVFKTVVNAVSISSNRTNQTVDRAMTPEYWIYECRVIACKCLLSLQFKQLKEPVTETDTHKWFSVKPIGLFVTELFSQCEP